MGQKMFQFVHIGYQYISLNIDNKYKKKKKAIQMDHFTEIVEVMTSSLDKFTTFDVNDCGYSDSARDLMVK